MIEQKFQITYFITSLLVILFLFILLYPFFGKNTLIFVTTGIFNVSLTMISWKSLYHCLKNNYVAPVIFLGVIKKLVLIVFVLYLFTTMEHKISNIFLLSSGLIIAPIVVRVLSYFSV